MKDAKNKIEMKYKVDSLIATKNSNIIIKKKEQEIILLKVINLIMSVYLVIPMILLFVFQILDTNNSLRRIMAIYYLVSLIFILPVINLFRKYNFRKKEIKGYKKAIEVLERIKNSKDIISINKLKKQILIAEEIGINPKKFLRLSKKNYLENILYKMLYNESDILYVYSLLAEYVVDQNKKILS